MRFKRSLSLLLSVLMMSSLVAIPAQAETFYFSVQARAGDAPRLQTLHASTGVFHRKTWDAANPTEKR